MTIPLKTGPGISAKVAAGIAAAGIAVGGGGPIAGTPSVTRYPAGNVLPGEPVHVYINSTSGFSVTNEYEEIDFEWDFDDSGATYTTGGGQSSDANTAFGRDVNHMWDSTGAKSVSVTARTSSGAATPVTVSVTVDDPNSRSWDAIIYYSQASNFSGAPTETGNVHHESTVAGVNALIGANSSVWIILRKGETYTWGATAFDFTDDGMFGYITGNNATRSFGTGAVPQINAGTSGTFVRKLGSLSNVVIVDCNFDGGYNAATAVASNGDFDVCTVDATAGANDNHGIALTRVTANGCSRAISGLGGGGSTNGNLYIRVYDCTGTDWFDYWCTSGSGEAWFTAQGCHIKQNPLAIMRDTSSGPFPSPDASDHGPIRFNGCRRIGVENCDIASSNGWSNYGGGFFIQPCLRFYPQQNDGMFVNVQRNIFSGSVALDIANHTTTVSVPIYPMKVIFDRNEIYIGRQSFGAIWNKGATGLWARNNVCYYANVYQDRGPGIFSFLVLKNSLNSSVVGDALTAPIVCEFNTIVSDRSATSGGNGDWQEYIVQPYDTGQSTTWQGTTPTTLNNIYEVPNHSNSGSFTNDSPLSRGDNFKPVTSTSAAVDAVSSGTIPVRDHDGNIRTSTTNRGAHHDDVASAASVTAPSNSVVPTIAELASFTNEWAATSHGTWSNWPNAYLIEFSWELNGTPITDDDLTVADVTALTGNLTLNVTATNTSGTRVTAESAASAV